MSIQHFYSQTVADGTATSVVRPSDWNSVHNQVLNMGGNTSGTSQISGADIVWAGGNNITLSANGSTVTIVGPTTVAQTVQTQVSGNIAGAGFTSTTTAGTAVVATHNSLGLSMGIPAYITTATQSVQTQASGNLAGIGYTSTTQAGSTVGATHNTAGLSMAWPPFITTYAAQTNQTQASGNIAGVGTTFGGTNVSGSMTLNSAGLALSLSAAAPGGGGAINVAAGTTNGNLQTISFVDGGGVTFGLNGSTITAAINTAPDAWSILGNTAGASNTLALTNDILYLSGGNNITLSQNGSTLAIVGAAGGGGGVTLGGHDPFDVGARSTQSLGQNTLALYPFEFPGAVSFNNVLQHVQMTCPTSSVAPVTNSTATTGSTGSMTAGQTVELYLFSRGTGGYSTNYYTAATTQFTLNSSASWSQTNSNTTTGTQTMGSSVWYTCGFPTLTTGTSNSGGSTVTTYQLTTGSFTNSSTSSAAVFPSVTAMTGYKGLYIPWSSTLNAGEYVLGMKRNSTTSGAWNGAGNISLNVYTYQSQDSLSAVGIPGVGTAVSNFGGPLGIGWGSFSATYASSVSTYPVSGRSTAALPLSGVQAHSPTATITFHNPIFFFQGDPL
jgi:predicted lipoprotein with Yx(FWY)xxD motif